MSKSEEPTLLVARTKEIDMSDILDGLRCSVNHANARHHVLEWLHFDVPMQAKVALTETIVNKLVDRLANSKTHRVEVEPKSEPVTEERE